MDKEEQLSEFVRERHEAFIAAVTKDEWDGVRRFAEKYGASVPDDERIMKAGTYKAVQECTDISQEVKDEAFMKCLELGFYPFIFWEEENGQGKSNN